MIFTAFTALSGASPAKVAGQVVVEAVVSGARAAVAEAAETRRLEGLQRERNGGLTDAEMRERIESANKLSRIVEADALKTAA